MRVAGLNIADDLLLDLAEQLRRRGFADPANKIEDAWVADESDVNLTIPDRVAILAVLDDPSMDLAQLRGVLIREHEWHRREGLV